MSLQDLSAGSSREQQMPQEQLAKHITAESVTVKSWLRCEVLKARRVLYISSAKLVLGQETSVLTTDVRCWNVCM